MNIGKEIRKVTVIPIKREIRAPEPIRVAPPAKSPKPTAPVKIPEKV